MWWFFTQMQPLLVLLGCITFVTGPNMSHQCNFSLHKLDVLYTIDCVPINWLINKYIYYIYTHRFIPPHISRTHENPHTNLHGWFLLHKLESSSNCAVALGPYDVPWHRADLRAGIASGISNDVFQEVHGTNMKIWCFLTKYQKKADISCNDTNSQRLKDLLKQQSVS